MRSRPGLGDALTLQRRRGGGDHGAAVPRIHRAAPYSGGLSGEDGLLAPVGLAIGPARRLRVGEVLSDDVHAQTLSREA
jgi:hypothetical protein